MIFEEIQPLYQFVLVDVNILMFLLVGLMLFSNWKWQSNYMLQTFWIVVIPLFGVISISNELGNLWFQLICMIFTILVNIFYLNQNLLKRT